MGGRGRTVESQPVELWMYDVSVSSMYGEPYQRPSMRRRGSVMRNSSLAPPGRSTVRTACPICFTMMLPPEKLVFCAECPWSVRPFEGLVM